MAKSMKVLKGAAVGAITLRLFRALPVDQAGWAVQAWSAYVDDGTEPEDIPEAYLGTWLSIKAEADALGELSRIRAKVGRSGGKANGSKSKQTEASGSKSKQTEAEERRVEENRVEEYVNTSGYGNAEGIARAGARSGGGGEKKPASSPLPSPALPEGMAEFLSDCPATWGEISARAEAVGCKPAWLLEWARHYHEQEWTYDRRAGSRRGTKAWVLGSIKAWAERQRSMDAEGARRGPGVTGNVTTPGVRVANRGGTPDLGF